MSFETRFPVRFGDVDHARVVYLPRYFHMFHQTLEEWFGKELGMAYSHIVGERDIGFPTVHADASFRHPLRYGDIVVASLCVQNMTARTLVCSYVLAREHDRLVAAEAVITAACVRNETFRSIAIPADIRTRIETYVDGQREASG